MINNTGDLYLDILALSLDFAKDRSKIPYDDYLKYLNKYCSKLKKLIEEAK